MRDRSFYRTRPRSSPEAPPDRLLILGDVLRNLVAIHAYYEARGERVDAVFLHEEECGRFEAKVSDAAWMRFNVKLVATDGGGVREYGREEIL